MALRPSKEENEDYYYGLPSQPVLVARSSGSEWTPKCHRGRWGFLIQKYLSNVGEHKIIDMWNAVGALRNSILTAIRPLQWHAIDILRIGYEPSDTYPNLHLQRTVTVFVTVEPGTATWEQAHPITMRCEEILRRAGIFDVDCDIKEGQLLTTSRRFPYFPVIDATFMRSNESFETIEILSDTDNIQSLSQRLPDRVYLEENHVRLTKEMGDIGVEAPQDLNQYASLEGMIPESELTSQRTGSQRLIVGKRGSSTGLTFGFANEVKSVVRRPIPVFVFHRYSEEWCITGIGGEFANQEDSGAFVWEAYASSDEKRRIGGKITSGVGSTENGECLTTYATPLDRLLKDTRDSSFKASLMGHINRMMGSVCGAR